MICTVSLNPAVDKYLRLPHLRVGEYSEVAEVIASAGGKAINVAGVLRTLGEQVLLLGFFGGFTGEFILAEVAHEGIQADPVTVASITRTAFVVVDDSGAETEIVEPGAPVTADDIAALRVKVRAAAARASVMVLSGSVPAGCPDDIYRLLLEDCGGRCPVILDTSRAWLRAVVMAPDGPKPTVVKPNHREAEALWATPIADEAGVVAALERLHRAGISEPLLSDGAAGIYGFTPNRVLRARSPRLPCLNSVGSGDAAVAGYAAGLARGASRHERLRLAAACGSANVLTRECACVRAEDVARLLPLVEVAPLRRRRNRRE